MFWEILKSLVLWFILPLCDYVCKCWWPLTFSNNVWQPHNINLGIYLIKAIYKTLRSSVPRVCTIVKVNPHRLNKLFSIPLKKKPKTKNIKWIQPDTKDYFVNYSIYIRYARWKKSKSGGFTKRSTKEFGMS